MRLQNKVAIITGAARGMGAAEARIFANEGAKVILADIQVEDGKHVTKEITDAGGEAVFVEMDVSNGDDWDRTIRSRHIQLRQNRHPHQQRRHHRARQPRRDHRGNLG